MENQKEIADKVSKYIEANPGKKWKAIDSFMEVKGVVVGHPSGRAMVEFVGDDGKNAISLDNFMVYNDIKAQDMN